MKKIKQLYIVGVVVLGMSIACSEKEPIYLAPSFNMQDAKDIMRTSATFSGSIVGQTSGINSYGFEYSLSEDFTNNLTTREEVGNTPTSSVFQLQVKGLSANERYYYRMYASTGASTVYSASQYFQTRESQVPIINPLQVDSIGEDMVRFKCTIEEIGDEYLIEYGVGYKTASDRSYNPVPSDSIVPVSVAGAENTFFVEIGGLESATRYSFRPYAKNSADPNGETGTREGYGDILEQQTANKKSAMVTTVEVMDGSVGINSVIMMGIVDAADGSGGVVDACGFCWSATNNTPSIMDSHMEVKVTKVGEYFTGTIEDLQPGRTYYVRAYAQNTVDGVLMTGYGKVYEITTTNLVSPSVDWVNDYEKITPTTISVRANIKNYDGSALVEKGIIWDKTRGELSIEEARKVNTYMKVEDGENMIDATIQKLEINTNYYVRAYAIYQAAGLEEIGYTSSRSFRTKEFERPNFDGIDINNVTYNTAEVSARISSEGNGTIIERGFCVSLISRTFEPTIANCDYRVISDKNFMSTITGLRPETHYAVRPYVISRLEGVSDTTYCWNNTFNTRNIEGPHMYWDWENIQTHTVTCDLAIRIEKLGDGEIVERGFCWLYRPDGDDGWVEATLENNDGVIIAETFTDKGFSATVAGLIPASRYTFSAYVKVIVGDYERVFYESGMGTQTNYLNYQLDITEKTGTSCKLEGYAYDEKLDGITEYGFVWSEKYVNPSEMENSIKATSLDADGRFSALMDKLVSGKTYYVGIYIVYKNKKIYADGLWNFKPLGVPNINENPSPEIKQ